MRPKMMVVALIFVGLSLDACLSFDTYCEERTDCLDGNDADVDACVVSEEAEEDRASLYGCTDEFEVFVECREQESTCENDQYVLLNNDCDDESREYSSCMGDNLPPSPF
jgi:hypothetical protein